MLKIFPKTEFIFLSIFSLSAAVSALFLAAREITWLFGDSFTMGRKYPYLALFFSSIAVWGISLFTPAKFNFFNFLKRSTLSLLPAVVILTIALSYSHKFHPFVFLLTNFCILSLFILFFRHYFSKSDFSGKFSFSAVISKTKKWAVENRLPLIFLAAAIAIYLIFGIHNLGKFAAVDEPLWTFGRIPKYWNNVADGEFNKTMISDKPGITVALVSGVGLLAVNPGEYKLIRHEGYLEQSGKNIENLNWAFRLPILIFGALGLLLLYFLTERLLGREAALFSSIFMALSPIVLGISRIVNPDSLLWIFMATALLSFLLHLKNKGSTLYIILTGILLGLSLLTKYVSNLLLFIFPFFIFLDYALRKNNELEKLNDFFRKSFLNLIAIIIISLFTFYAFLPATWINPARLLEATFFSEAFIKFWPIFLFLIAFLVADTLFWKNLCLGKMAELIRNRKKIIINLASLTFVFFSLFTFLNTHLGMPWYDFEFMVASPKTSVFFENFFGSFSANFYSLIFGLTPLALLGGIFALIGSFWNKDELEKKYIFYFSIFILVYYFASTVNNVSATVRYQIVVFPVFMAMAGIGLKNFSEIASRGNSFKIVLYAAVVAVGIWSLNFIRPFYFSYASSFLPEKYVLNYKDMGDGSYEAAEFLNNLPEAQNKIVWTDKRGVCYFFIGKCLNDYNLKEGQLIDYFVISAGRKNRTEKLILTKGRENTFELPLNKLYDREDFIKIIKIGGRPGNYIKIFSTEELNLKK